MSENSERLGKILRSELANLNPDIVTESRGKGLMNAIIIKSTEGEFPCGFPFGVLFVLHTLQKISKLKSSSWGQGVVFTTLGEHINGFHCSHFSLFV